MKRICLFILLLCLLFTGCVPQAPTVQEPEEAVQAADAL